MKFVYQARTASGKSVKGEMEAADKQAVVRTLRDKKLTPMSVEPAAAGGMGRDVKLPGFGPKVKTVDLAVFSRQFATMINAGLPLLRSLSILADQADNPALGKILTEVASDVEGGKSLTAALKEHKEFPKLYVAMVRAGETAGMLDQVLDRLAETLEKDVALRGKIKSAMTYPVIVLVMAFVMVIGMLLFIVPTFGTMFNTLGGTLPLPTQVLVTASDFMKTPVGIAALLGVPFAGRFAFKRFQDTEQGRIAIDKAKLRVPIFGTLFHKIAVSRFSRNLSVLLRAGVPVLQALEITGETSGNHVVEAALKDVRSAVQTGDQIARPLAQFDVFPPMVVQMVAVGEETGAIDEMLDKIADFYERDVEAMSESLTSMMEPLMIGVLGLVAGGMVIALYLPIFKVIEMVQ